MQTIESGIAMPLSTRTTKGDSRLNSIKEALAALTVKGQSFLLEMESYEKAQEERRHYVNRANTYGKAHKKEFVIAAVDGSAAIAAIAAKGNKPAIAAIAAKKPGIRIWLANQPEPEVSKPEGEVVVPPTI